jgi:hypothetical protein
VNFVGVVVVILRCRGEWCQGEIYMVITNATPKSSRVEEQESVNNLLVRP